ncbi:MAG: CarD family transcriptional regulator [Bryobacteraceae bacterium]|nr:CarD family transcriptional regulator [Bryobacteraceae bacterium]
MTFQVGEKVVYPNHGVGTIENISTRAFGSSQEHFYLLRLTYNSMTVMVPFSHVADVGLRKVTRAGEIARVLAFLAAGPVKFSADWKVRYKVSSEKMRSGALPEIAEVFKVLTIIQAEKPLSFREKKMLDCSRRMLLSEVSICRGINEADAVDLLRSALSKAGLPMPEAL